MGQSVEMGTSDTHIRQVTMPVPSNADQTAEFAAFVSAAALDGYTIDDASEITGGTQRDPCVIGMRVKLRRED